MKRSQETSKPAVLIGWGVLFLPFVLVFLLRPREPVHDEKSLSYWVAQLKNTNLHHQQQARKALREIGPQAIPFLLRMARSEGSVLKRWHREAWFRLRDWIRAHLGQPESEDAALSLISHALHELGPTAGPALMKAMEDKNANARYVAGAAFPCPQTDPIEMFVP